MKIALCFHGYFNNKNSNGNKSVKYIKKNIINKNDIDIFCHSWDINKKNIILKNYNFKDNIFEPQIDFKKKLSKEQLIFVNKFKNNNIYKQYYKVENVLSFYYSRKKSILLAIEYSKNNNIKYDFILTCRFDLGTRCQIHLGYRPDILHFQPLLLDSNNFYSAMWNQLNAGFTDCWFISNQTNMEKFSFLYDYYLENLFENGNIIKKFSKWKDSNIKDFKSNEILKIYSFDRSEEYLCNVDKVNIFNSHYIIKSYLIDCNLYKKVKFIKNGDCKHVTRNI